MNYKPKCKTQNYKLLEEVKRENIYNMGLSRFTTLPKRFLDRTPKTQSINEQSDK